MALEGLQVLDATYAGETDLNLYVTQRTLQMDTVKEGCLMIKDDIKKQYTIPFLDITNIIQDRAAQPISQGNWIITGKQIVPRDYMIYTEFNPRDLEVNWQAIKLNKELIDRQLPETTNSWVIMYTLQRNIEFNEQAIWRSRIAFHPLHGNVNPTTKGQLATDSIFNKFDGLIVKILNDATTIQVAGAQVLTVNNIISQLYNSYNSVPQALLHKYGIDGLRGHISYNTMKIYEEAQSELTFKSTDTTEKGIRRSKGYDLAVLAGMPDNTIIWTVSEPTPEGHFWLGLNSATDETNVKMMPVNNAGENWFLKILMKADTQIGWGTEIVISTTITQ